MKEFFNSLLPLLGAIIVSIVLIPVGVIYSFGYMLYMTVTLKEPKALLKLLWRWVDGMFCTIGYIILELAIGLDMLWNVNGEILEDSMTHKEDTHFGEKGITVSSSVGELEVSDNLNKTGIGFSKVLNKAFRQKRHAVDSWKMHLAKKKLSEQYENVRNT